MSCAGAIAGGIGAAVGIGLAVFALTALTGGVADAALATGGAGAAFVTGGALIAAFGYIGAMFSGVFAVGDIASGCA